MNFIHVSDTFSFYLFRDDFKSIPRPLQLCSLYQMGLPHPFICTRQAVPTAAQLVVRAPLTVHRSHRYSGSPTGCPLTLEFPGLACLRLNAVHLFHSCLSLWSPTTVLFFPLSSPQWRHLSPTTPILYVHGRCGPFIH